MKPADLIARAAVDAADVALASPKHDIDTPEQVLHVWLRGFRAALEYAKADPTRIGLFRDVVAVEHLDELDTLAEAARDSLHGAGTVRDG